MFHSDARCIQAKRLLLAFCLGVAGLADPLDPLASVVLVHGSTQCSGSPQGSGVVVAPGVVATNAHVLRGSGTASVRWEGRVWPATVRAVSTEMDLCLLSVPNLPAPPAEPAASGATLSAAPVCAIGFPWGQGPKISGGHILTLWSFCGETLLQSDAATHPGSSGGGLFTQDGHLVGITTFVFMRRENMNFSIPFAWVRKLLEQSPEKPPLPQPCQSLASVLEDFLGQMAAEPANWPALDHMAHAWVAERPMDPDAWMALSFALNHELKEQVKDGQAAHYSRLIEESIDAAMQVLSLDGSNPRAWNNLGVAMDLDGHFKEAEAAFLKAVELDPAYALAWFNLGTTQLNGGRFEASRDAFLRGLALQPDNGTKWGTLAYIEGKIAAWDQALEHSGKALRYRPFDASLWFDRTEICWQAGDLQGYRSAIERLESLDPALAKRARTLGTTGVAPRSRKARKP